MNVYFMHVVYEQERNSYAWPVDLTDQQEAEILANMDREGWVFQSKLSFDESDPAQVSLPYTGTVKGQFVLYYE